MTGQLVQNSISPANPGANHSRIHGTWSAFVFSNEGTMNMKKVICLAIGLLLVYGAAGTSAGLFAFTAVKAANAKHIATIEAAIR